MGLFTTRKPRKFRPVSIYTDERKDKLQKLVDDIKRQQGLLSEEEKPYDPTKFKGTFIEFTPHAKKYKESSSRLGWPLALILVVALMLLWRFLLTGKM